jgi:hypothetical protein
MQMPLNLLNEIINGKLGKLDDLGCEASTNRTEPRRR